LRFATTETVRPAARLALLCFLICVPAFAQTVPPEPDPLSRIRAQPPAQACSATEVTLCDEAAPKIIANAMGSASTIEANLRQLVSGEGGHAMGAPASPAEVAEVRAVDWAVAALRAAGVDVHTESYTLPVTAVAPGPVKQSLAKEQENVVGEIRGREKPDEIVILGARLDTSVVPNGAPEDDYDAAVVIEAARAIVATGLVPRRTIRFVLFAAPEPGMVAMAGSWSYVQAHQGELDHTIAAIIFDEGADRVTGYSLGGRHDVDPGVREALGPLGSLGTLNDSYDPPLTADSFDFLLEGVPNLLASQGKAIEVPTDRAASATLDKLDFNDLKRNAAIAGVTAFDVAEDVAPLGPRLPRAEIGTLLKQTGLDEKMEAAGIWGLWEFGNIGRQP
jgi:hypothetical protein